MAICWSILKWTAERDIKIIPYGLDLSEKLTELAKQRLPKYKQNIHTGNGWLWRNPVQFDYVHTEIVYVPEQLQKQYVERIMKNYLKDKGNLLLTEYRSSKDSVDRPWLDEALKRWKLKMIKYVSGFFNNIELTRVWVITK